MVRKPAEYAIYQGDKFLDIGTAAELAERFRVLPETIGFWATPTHHQRMKKKDGDIGNRKVVIRIEEDEEDGES